MRNLVLAIASVALASCTTYKDGVGSYWPQPDVLVVSGSGNGFTEPQRVTDFVWLQAAEKALQSGYKYFVLLDQQDTSVTTTGTYYTPQTTNVSGYTTGNYFSGTATTYGGATSYPIFKPGMDAAFRLFEDVPPNYRAGQYWSAASVYNELGPKYLGSKFSPARLP